MRGTWWTLVPALPRSQLGCTGAWFLSFITPRRWITGGEGGGEQCQFLSSESSMNAADWQVQMRCICHPCVWDCTNIQPPWKSVLLSDGTCLWNNFQMVCMHSMVGIIWWNVWIAESSPKWLQKAVSLLARLAGEPHLKNINSKCQSLHQCRVYKMTTHNSKTPNLTATFDTDRSILCVKYNVRLTSGYLLCQCTSVRCLPSSGWILLVPHQPKTCTPSQMKSACPVAVLSASHLQLWCSVKTYL